MNYFETILRDLFENAKNNKIVIKADGGDWLYKTKFYVKLAGEDVSLNEDVPYIDIPDLKLLANKSDLYLKETREFYNDDKEYFMVKNFSFDKHLLYFLFVNMTNYDINNVYQYVDNRTRMIKESKNFSGKTYYLGHYSDNTKIDFDIFAKIKKNRSNLETPLDFEINIKKDNQNFFLPTIHFGVENGKVFVAGIQNFYTQQESELAKTLDRYFRKVNKNIESGSLEANVSPNAVVSMAIFFKFLKQHNIKDVEVCDYMPLRYASSLECKKEKFKKQNKNESEVYDLMDKNQFNMTNKLMNLMLRMAVHFDNLLVDYNQTKNQMEIKLTDSETTKNDNIIHKIYDSVKVEAQHSNEIKKLDSKFIEIEK